MSESAPSIQVARVRLTNRFDPIETSINRMQTSSSDLLCPFELYERSWQKLCYSFVFLYYFIAHTIQNIWNRKNVERLEGGAYVLPCLALTCLLDLRQGAYSPAQVSTRWHLQHRSHQRLGTVHSFFDSLNNSSPARVFRCAISVKLWYAA
jgi:hypothetical protein